MLTLITASKIFSSLTGACVFGAGFIWFNDDFFASLRPFPNLEFTVIATAMINDESPVIDLFDKDQMRQYYCSHGDIDSMMTNGYCKIVHIERPSNGTLTTLDIQNAKKEIGNNDKQKLATEHQLYKILITKRMHISLKKNRNLPIKIKPRSGIGIDGEIEGSFAKMRPLVILKGDKMFYNMDEYYLALKFSRETKFNAKKMKKPCFDINTKQCSEHCFGFNPISHSSEIMTYKNFEIQDFVMHQVTKLNTSDTSDKNDMFEFVWNTYLPDTPILNKTCPSGALAASTPEQAFEKSSFYLFELKKKAVLNSIIQTPDLIKSGVENLKKFSLYQTKPKDENDPGKSWVFQFESFAIPTPDRKTIIYLDAHI